MNNKKKYPLATFTSTGTEDPEKKKWSNEEDVDFNSIGNGEGGMERRKAALEHFRSYLQEDNDQKAMELHDQVAADPNHPQAQEHYKYLNKKKVGKTRDDKFLLENNVPLKRNAVGKGHDLVKDNMEKFGRPFVNRKREM